MWKWKSFLGISPNSVDLCMIDGDHNSPAVLDDARSVYKLLKPGGWMLFDDVENDLPKRHHVQEGMQQFLEEVGDGVSHLWKHKYMECYRKE